VLVDFHPITPNAKTEPTKCTQGADSSESEAMQEACKTYGREIVRAAERAGAALVKAGLVVEVVISAKEP